MRRNVINLLVMVLLVLVHSASFAQTPASEPFAQCQVTLANGIKGENVKFDSGNPPTYASVLSQRFVYKIGQASIEFHLHSWST